MNDHPATAWYQDDVRAGPGGVMTDDVGVITGDLTVRTTLGDDGRSAHVTVQYTGAEEWYTLTGSPAPSRTAIWPPTTRPCSTASDRVGLPKPADPQRTAAAACALA